MDNLFTERVLLEWTKHFINLCMQKNVNEMQSLSLILIEFCESWSLGLYFISEMNSVAKGETKKPNEAFLIESNGKCCLRIIVTKYLWYMQFELRNYFPFHLGKKKKQPQKHSFYWPEVKFIIVWFVICPLSLKISLNRLRKWIVFQFLVPQV